MKLFIGAKEKWLFNEFVFYGFWSPFIFRLPLMPNNGGPANVEQYHARIMLYMVYCILHVYTKIISCVRVMAYIHYIILLCYTCSVGICIRSNCFNDQIMIERASKSRQGVLQEGNTNKLRIWRRIRSKITINYLWWIDNKIRQN